MGDSVPPFDLLAALRDAPLGGDDAEPLDRRARAIARIEVAIEASALVRRRSASRVALLGAAATIAAAAAVAIAWVHPGGARLGATDATPVAQLMPFARVHVSHGALLVRGVGAERLLASDAPDASLPPGATLALGADAAADLAFASGVRVHLAAGSVAHLPSDAAGARFALDAGHADLEVPKLGADRSFTVVTGDADVVVHGTSFGVEVASAGERAFTLIDVREGLVSVADRATSGAPHFVRPGERWSTLPVAAPAAVVGAPLGNPTVAPSVEAGRAAPAAHPAPLAAPLSATSLGEQSHLSTTSLGEQNRLLTAALDASRAGRDAAALATLDELLARFPSAPLAHEARVERFRALERLGRHGEAARDARRYLAAHRDGYARDEARRIALPASGASPTP